MKTSRYPFTWRVLCALLVLLVMSIMYLTPEARSDEIVIRPFTTDGCSAWPDGTFKHKDLWLRCCTEHDIAYWRGGTREERRAADEALRTCVAEAGEPEIAAIMLAGVRVGGSPYWPTSFRWGYGWAWLRGYRGISPAEQVAVDNALGEAGINP